MPVTATPIYPQALDCTCVSFVNADGAASVNASTNNKIVFTAGANGSKIEALLIGANDTSSRDVYITLHNGTSFFTIAEVNIPISSGYGSNSAPTVDLLRSTQLLGLTQDSFGNRYLYLPSGWKLYVGMVVAVTAGKQVNVFAQGADF